MIISNEEVEGITKVKQNNKETDSLVCYLGILGASWLENMLANKGFAQAGDGTIRVGQIS